MSRIRLYFIVLYLLLPLPAWSGDAGIATAHPLATDAAKQVLDKGGNAFDAAIAASAALAVVEPYGSGLGGGGFWLLHRASDGFEVMLDGRETAPLAATRDMYLDDTGEVIEGASLNGPLAAGIPGVPAALAHLAEHYGKLSLKDSLAPAIKLARDGFPMDEAMQRYMGFRLDLLKQFPETRRVFLPDGEVPAIGTLVKQPELAQTLDLLAEKGHDGFYAGKLAEQLVEEVRANGGIWSLKDLREYRVSERAPVKSKYKGVKITAAALPSSGGVVLAQMLNILEKQNLEKVGEVERVHLLTEAMRRAYRDRAEYLGDADFVDVPVEKLIDKDYADELRASINAKKATASDTLKAVAGEGVKGADTTHFSMIDREGNRVAATLSINYPFGSGFIAKGTGVLLNNEMDDFSIRPGTPNVYGLVGAEANAIEPGKRMLSSMTPAFLEDGNRVLVIGTPGGSRIITMVLQGALEFAGGADAHAIVNRKRIHHQYLPDAIQYEPDALDEKTVRQLQSMGHTLVAQESDWGNMQAVILDKRSGRVDAASDSRGIGKAVSISR